MAFNSAEILCFENYCALAVSVYGKRLICPELAFEKMGINILPSIEDRNKYRWTLNGPHLYKDMEALRELGWCWGDVADYFGLTPMSAMKIHNRAKNIHERRKQQP